MTFLEDSFVKLDQIGYKDQHILINGDNLTTLEILAKEYTEKISLIYIDPPYNTGKKMGKYNDSFSSHDNWVSFMRPRLWIARELLSSSGTIWISIGENEFAYLKILCNSVFGENNHVSTIIWQNKYTVSNDKHGISNQTEYILVYAKNKKDIKINYDPLKEEYIKKSYRNPDNDPRGDWRLVQLYKKKNKFSYIVKAPNGKEWNMPWNYSKDNWKNVLEKNNLIYWGKDGNACPQKKIFLKDSKGTVINNLWLGEEVGFTSDGGNTLENIMGNRNDFIYPKPVSLMKRILEVGSDKNAIVMDFFAGSGTFGHAVLEMNKTDNRQFILVTNNENNICDQVTFPRLQKVINGYVGKDGKQYEGAGGDLVYWKNDIVAKI